MLQTRQHAWSMRSSSHPANVVKPLYRTPVHLRTIDPVVRLSRSLPQLVYLFVSHVDSTYSPSHASIPDTRDPAIRYAHTPFGPGWHPIAWRPFGPRPPVQCRDSLFTASQLPSRVTHLCRTQASHPIADPHQVILTPSRFRWRPFEDHSTIVCIACQKLAFIKALQQVARKDSNEIFGGLQQNILNLNLLEFVVSHSYLFVVFTRPMSKAIHPLVHLHSSFFIFFHLSFIACAKLSFTIIFTI